MAVESAQQIMRMKPLPDEFLSPMILWLLSACEPQEQGIRIPEDIAVVGFNNDAIAKLIEPQ